MLYLNENDMNRVGVKWDELFLQIERAIKCLANGDFAQPIKPYLRYKELRNRIIAMPAFVGGEFQVSGIKWIASFPDNIKRNIPRAHSVLVLNDADTGEPVCIINTAKLSIIRTVSVTGVVIKYFSAVRKLKDIKLGIIGWGPIGQHHFKMCTDFLGDNISNISIFDLRPIDKDSIDFPEKNKINITRSWEEAYEDSDIFITCTVSSAPYIYKKPKPGALLLNVSLRDFKTDIFEYVKNSIIVDDWDEVCREKTDIEMMHKEKNLQKEHTISITEIINNNGMNRFGPDEPVMFNPMGMAVFDVAVGCHYMREALKMGIGTKL